MNVLQWLYEIFVNSKEDLAKVISEEMGMPIRLARDDVQYGLNYYRWYLDHASEYLKPEIVFENDSEIHRVYHEPLGVVVAITPWNYPFMLFSWSCIQALLAGNTVIWKISKEVILTGKYITSLIERSALPSGVLVGVFWDGSLGDILTDQEINGVTFTGSTAVWQQLRTKAFQKWIPIMLELGWSAPGILCEDADIDSIIETIYFMRYSNSWQMCDGLKRLIVHHTRYEEFMEKLQIRLSRVRIGNPHDEWTDIWPLASKDQHDRATKQIDDALGKWAKVWAVCSPWEQLNGAYFPLYLLENISHNMLVWTEETFCPILPVVPYYTTQEAIDLANDTPYGLWAYIFTDSFDLFDQIARQIKSGMVQMNNVNYCIPQDPFWGYKLSGIWREHGKWWFHEFSNIKVISQPKK